MIFGAKILYGKFSCKTLMHLTEGFDFTKLFFAKQKVTEAQKIWWSISPTNKTQIFNLKKVHFFPKLICRLPNDIRHKSFSSCSCKQVLQKCWWNWPKEKKEREKKKQFKNWKKSLTFPFSEFLVHNFFCLSEVRRRFFLEK